MDIIIIGAGAMGGLFGGLLAEAGQDVSLIDIPGPHLSALIQKGLRLQTASGDRIIRLPAGPAASFAVPCDLAIVFTNNTQTESALRAASHLIGLKSWVLTLGLANEAAIRKAVPHARVATGTTTWSADLAAPGHIVSHGHGTVHIGSTEPDSDAIIRRIAAVLTTAGLNCLTDPQTLPVAETNPLAQLPLGSIAGHPDGRLLVFGIVMETLAIAKARGLTVDADRVRQTLGVAFTGHPADPPPATRQPEAINNALIASAAELGIDTPETKTTRDLVRLIAHAIAARLD
jgi:2-dehydropantoate 2-reductase